jgi:hypothetical protein
MCDNESTSVEHAPPRGFFPTGKRINLITVPSCKAHNEDTSKDDEYVRNIITTSIENNQTSIDHFLDKSLRSYQRSPKLVAEVIKSLNDVSDYKENAKAYQFERARFDRVIRKIAYALFYKEFDFTWDRLLAATTNQIKMADMSNDHLGDLFETLSDDLNELTLKGENPLVFQYSFIDFGNNPHDKALFMLFYEGFPFLIIPDKTSNHNDFD